MAIRRERLRVLALALGLLALALYGDFLARNAAHAVGGSDSSGYANSARRLLSRTLVARPRSLELLGLPDSLAEIVTPLGFIAGPRPGTITPFYPVGFPAHLAAAALVGGWEKGPYLVSPVAAVLCLVFLYLLGRDLGLSPAWSAGTTAALAAWPAFLFQAIQPMSDIVATLWTTAAIFFAVRARRRPAWAAACGAALGLAVLVRPTNLILVIPLLLAIPLTLRCLGLLVLGGAPMAGAQAAFNATCYGGIFASGYRNIGLLDAMALANFPVRIRSYGSWISQTLTPIVPLAAIASATDRRTPARDRTCFSRGSRCFFFSTVSTAPTKASDTCDSSCRERRGFSSRQPSECAPLSRGFPERASRPRSRSSPWRSCSPSSGDRRAASACSGRPKRRRRIPGPAGGRPPPCRRGAPCSPSTRAARSSTTQSFRTSAGTRSGPRDGRRCEPVSRARRLAPLRDPLPRGGEGFRRARPRRLEKGRRNPGGRSLGAPAARAPNQRTRMTRRSAASPPSRDTAVTVSVWPPGARLGIAKWNPSRGPSGLPGK